MTDHIETLREILANEYAVDESVGMRFTMERAAIEAAIAALAQAPEPLIYKAAEKIRVPVCPEDFNVPPEFAAEARRYAEFVLHLALAAPVAAKPVGVEEADEALACANFFEGVRVFVTSRERIKHPEGTDLFDEHVTRLLRLASLLRFASSGRKVGES